MGEETWGIKSGGNRAAVTSVFTAILLTQFSCAAPEITAYKSSTPQEPAHQTQISIAPLVQESTSLPQAPTSATTTPAISAFTSLKNLTLDISDLRRKGFAQALVEQSDLKHVGAVLMSRVEQYQELMQRCAMPAWIEQFDSPMAAPPAYDYVKPTAPAATPVLTDLSNAAVSDKVRTLAEKNGKHVAIDAQLCLEKMSHDQLAQLLDIAVGIEDMFGLDYLTTMGFAYHESSLGTNPDAKDNTFGNDLIPLAKQIKYIGNDVLDVYEKHSVFMVGGHNILQPRIVTDKNGKPRKDKKGKTLVTPSATEKLRRAVQDAQKGGTQQALALRGEPALAMSISAVHIQKAMPEVVALVRKHSPKNAELIINGIASPMLRIGVEGVAHMAAHPNEEIGKKGYVNETQQTIYKLARKTTNLEALTAMAVCFVKTKEALAQLLSEERLAPAPRSSHMVISEKETPRRHHF